jgi:LCP family protein required for cell wall assembly
MNLLLVGSDYRYDNYLYGLGDVIRLVRVDFVKPQISVLEFPRDLWVEIPDIADNINGQDHEKLNQAYLYGNKGFGYTDDPAQGPGLLARTLAINFGVQLDHYVGVNMRTFVKVVDAVGGIEVDLADTIDGRTAEDRSKRLLFLKGHHLLSGDEALTFARIRIEGVFTRADNQDLVLCALREKLTRPEVVTQIPQLIASFRDNIQTDLSPEQIGQLACLGPQLPPGNIVFASFPEELFKPTHDTYDPVFKKTVFIWDVDFNILRDYVARFQLGLWPTPSSAVSSPEEEEPILCQ